MIEHRAEDGIEWKLGVQKCGGFQEQVQLAKTAAYRFRTSDVFDAGEEVGYGFLAAG
jgi:hypothetical protein